VRRGRPVRGVGALARIEVTVSPGAARTELVGRHGAGWRARIAAPPERGRANRALVALLAEVLGVPRDRLAVVAGAAARHKVVEIEGLEPAELDRRLEAASRDRS
jgi:uncharacterized protein